MINAANEMDLSHGQLMSLLYAMHGGVTDDQKSKIKNRFKNLQKAGMPSGDRPARGTRAKYSFRQVCETVLAFEFAKQWRADAGTIKKCYDQFNEAVTALEHIAILMVANEAFSTLYVTFERTSIEMPDAANIGVYLTADYIKDTGRWKKAPPVHKGGILVVAIVAEEMLEVFSWAQEQA